MNFNPIVTLNTAFPEPAIPSGNYNVSENLPPWLTLDDLLDDSVRSHVLDYPGPSRNELSSEGLGDSLVESADSLMVELGNLADAVELGPLVSDLGDEALAFYVPYSFGGPSLWGIWWNEPAMLRAIAQVALSMNRLISHTTISAVAHYLRRTIRQHELFHFTVEYTSAHIGVQHSTDFYRPSFTSGTRRELEEQLATAWEMYWLENRRGGRRASLNVVRVLQAVWESQPLPFPYDGWPKARKDWVSFARNHAKELGMFPEAGDLYKDLIKLVPADPRPAVIPEYSVGIKRVSRIPLWWRLSPPAPKAVIHHAERAKRNGSPPGVDVIKKRRHPVAISRRGKRRPITIDSEKWDRVDYPILKQLADLFDLSMQDYVEAVYSKWG